MSRGNLIVITAASATGKTSLVRQLLSTIEKLAVSVSYTTRSPRPQDQEGVDYHFLDEAKFKDMVSAGEFLEHATIYGCHYGTSRRTVETELTAGNDVILEIDWQGAKQIKQRFPKAVTIFVLPPSMAELERRIRHRAQDKPKQIERRLAAAHEELSHYDEFDYLVVNDQFEEAMAQLTQIIYAHRLQTNVQKDILASLLNQLLN